MSFGKLVLLVALLPVLAAPKPDASRVGGSWAWSGAPQQVGQHCERAATCRVSVNTASCAVQKVDPPRSIRGECDGSGLGACGDCAYELPGARCDGRVMCGAAGREDADSDAVGGGDPTPAPPEASREKARRKPRSGG